jgi:hypothetical protein
MAGFFHWLGRVIMLSLAGMITLSIISAIAAIPSGGNIARQIGIEQREWPMPQPEEKPRPAQPVPQAPAEEPAAQAPVVQAPAEELVQVPAQPEKADPALWLEAITYALLALVLIGVAGLLLLGRLVSHWRRSADALEAIAARRG